MGEKLEGKSEKGERGGIERFERIEK